MNQDQPWYRRSRLPVGELRGEFVVTEAVLAATRDALVSFAQEGREDGGHEGLVLWAGREFDSLTAFTAVIIPEVDNGPQHVRVSREGVGAAARAARAVRLGILAQVHSHPGDDGRHSDGDDDMVMMPFERMLSLVAPDYGRRLHSLSDLSVHQYQSGEWVWCEPASASRGFSVVPTTISLR